MKTSRKLFATLALVTVFLTGGVMAQQRPVAPVSPNDVPELLQTLQENVGLSGNVVLALGTRERLAKLGRQDNKAVVPAIVEALEAPLGEGQRARDYRLALIGVLQDIGTAAEAAVPVLTEIVQDPDKRNEWLRFHAEAALRAINTPEAEAAAKAASARTMQKWRKDALNAKGNLRLRCCGCRVSTGLDRRLAIPRLGLNGEW